MLSWLLVIFMTAAPALAAGPVLPPHVRPLDPAAVDLVSTGSRRSSTLDGLIQTLDRSSGLVIYVTTKADPDGRGSTVFVSHAADITYLLVRISARQGGSDKLAVLAHELMHAVEISGSARPILDEHDLRILYSSIGTDPTGEHLESDAAKRIERAVQSELRHGR